MLTSFGIDEAKGKQLIKYSMCASKSICTYSIEHGIFGELGYHCFIITS